jgi:hypothetical protein
MSEPDIFPQNPGGGPLPRPDTTGVPGVDGGLKQPGRNDELDPAVQGDGDIGPDVPGMPGEG